MGLIDLGLQNMSTGDIELEADEMEVLSVAKTQLPLTVRDQIKVKPK